MALDRENKNPGYLCGRLFAILENLQRMSLQGGRLNVTIKDRYYTAASTVPVTVFCRLLNLSNHHLAKLNEGGRIYFERLIGEVMTNIDADGFPNRFRPEDQWYFAVGYYHQRSELFKKKEKRMSGGSADTDISAG